MTGFGSLWQSAIHQPPGRPSVVSDSAIDYDQLEGYLQALAHGRRLELLNILQVPHALAEIRITPGKNRAGERPDRPASRQAIQRHIEILQDIGVIISGQPTGGGSKQFVVDRQRVFQVLEELRRVGTITAGAFVSRDATAHADAVVEPQAEVGPKLVLVHGFVEGKVFPLRRASLTNAGAWVIGRKAGVHVCLDYDPFVSLVNSEIGIEDERFYVRDLGISRNGTTVNWRRIGSDPVALRPGDVIGVGRSLLAFQPQ